MEALRMLHHTLGEILEDSELGNSSNYICWLDVDSDSFTANCSVDPTDVPIPNPACTAQVNKTAAIKCKMESKL